MTAILTRAEQAEIMLDALRQCAELGYGEVTVEVTRGGTVRLTVKRGGEGRPVQHQYATGRKR